MTRKFIKMSMRKLLAILLILLAFVFCVSVFRVGASSVDETASAVSEAEEVVASAYEAVLEAEKAGANVADLLSVLNEAGMLLSRARLAYSVGHFVSARDFAVWCKGNLTGFVDEAEALEQSAVQGRYWDFMVNVVGSTVGVVAIVCGGLVVWFFLERRGKSRGNVK